MPIKTADAAAQVVRLASLPYYPSNKPEAVNELVQALASEAKSLEQAAAAVSALLGDIGRASNIESNRVPSPGELRAWVQAVDEEARQYWQTPKREFCMRCGGSGEQGIYGLTIDQILAHPNGGRETCRMCGGTGEPVFDAATETSHT